MVRLYRVLGNFKGVFHNRIWYDTSLPVFSHITKEKPQLIKSQGF
jgi:hypothetical protein